MRISLLPFLFVAFFVPFRAGQAPAPRADTDETLILSEPADPYYALAQEMAGQERVPVVHTLAEVLDRNPIFVLWVVSPAYLSDQVMVEFGLALRDWPSAISVGIISGSTLEDARALWLRALEVDGAQVFAANAANPHGHIAAEIASFDREQTTTRPLTLENLIQSLQEADYLTFSGHGGHRFLRLNADTILRPGHVPSLPPAVIATSSCNTFRLWEEASIALRFTDQGAAAYAGFAYSPNSGYLIGGYGDAPFRYTWPEFPIGHAVQVQNHGTLQGFAHFPYYWLLGDPRISLQAGPPHRLVETHSSNGALTLSYADAPAGMVPVRISGGAEYSFVRIPGVSAAWAHDPFYNARLQMADVRDDKFVLFAHDGGDVELHLQARPPWPWVVGDVLTDALDSTLLYTQQASGTGISLAAAAVALIVIALLLWRQRLGLRPLPLATVTGVGFAALHGLYALLRLEHVTLTSKAIVFSPLTLVATCLLVGCGAFLFLQAESWRGRLVAVWVASFHALAPALFGTAALAAINLLAFVPALGASLYNYALGVQPLIVFVLEGVLFGLAFSALRRTRPWFNSAQAHVERHYGAWFTRMLGTLTNCPLG